MKSLPFLLLSLLLALSPPLHAQQQGGSLTPGLAPAVSMKSLDKIDPGIALMPADAPFTITTPGHYYLTGNVTSVAASSSVFTVQVSNVTIDLRGFALIANGGTAGTADTSAIYADFNINQVTVRNGIIDGNWHTGVWLRDARTSSCENLRIRGTSDYGITSGRSTRVANCHIDGGTTPGSGFVSTAGIFGNIQSLVINCTAIRCDGVGIQLNPHSCALDCSAYFNISTGITGATGSVISRCTSSGNTGSGISVASSATVSNCTAQFNIFAGFSIGKGSSLAHCAAYANSGAGFLLSVATTATGCSSLRNGDDGFIGTSQAQLTNCVAVENDLEGFDLGRDNILTACLASENKDNGFSSDLGSLFNNCVARTNGQSPVNAAADGFEITTACRLRDCLASDNRGSGIRATDIENDLRDNHLHSNDGDGITLTSTSNLVIGNYTPSNGGLPINPAPAAAGNIGPSQDGFGGASPNANFQ